MAITTTGFTSVKPDLWMLEVFDEELTHYPLVQTTPKSGGTITDVQTNAAGGFRITVASAGTYAKRLSVKNCTDNGSGLFRIEVYSTTGLSNGATVYVNDVGGCPTANGTWVISNVSGTTFDLNSSTFAGTYTFGGYVGGSFSGDSGFNENSQTRFLIRDMDGDLGDQLNAVVWYGALWSSTEIDIVTEFPASTKFASVYRYEILGVPQKLHAYTSGGVIMTYFTTETATNPYTAASASALRVGRNNDWWKFNGPTVTNYDHLDRDDADDYTNYPAIGGVAVVGVYRKSVPWQQSGNHTNSIKQARMKHQLFIELASDLPYGTYDVDLSFLGLGTVELDWHDTTTRSHALATSLVGFRPGDPYKRAFLRAWVPGYGAEDGAVDFAAFAGADKGHIIDADGTILDSFDITLRLDITDVENGHTGWNSVNRLCGAITGAANNGAGLIRITIASAVYNIRLQTGTRVMVGQVGGVPNATGTWVITRISNTQFDLQGSTFAGTYTSSGFYYANMPLSSTTNTIPIEDIDHTVVPCQITATAHGLANDTLVRIENVGINNPVGSRGPSAASAQVSLLERCAASGTEDITLTYVAQVVDPDTIELYTPRTGLAVDVSTATVAYDPGSGGVINPLNQVNSAGTYVYECDFDAFETEGIYRFYVEGLGVTDPFRIDEKVWADAATFHFAAEYHQRCDIKLDGRFGTSNPYGSYLDGEDTTKKYRSKLPLVVASQGLAGLDLLTTNPLVIPAGALVSGQWATMDRVSSRGGHMDAADCDCYIYQHCGIYARWASIYSQVPACRSIDWKTPKLSQVLGGIWDSSTDDMGSILSSAIWGVHYALEETDGDGISIGGQVGVRNPRLIDLGQMGFEPSYLFANRIGVYAGDHFSNYQLACTAAIISRCLTLGGYTTQAAWYLAKAELLYSWAESILASAPLSGGVRDTYYRTTCNLANSYTNWTDAEYEKLQKYIDFEIAGTITGSAIVYTGINTSVNQGVRAAAAAALFRLTGDTDYQDDFAESYPTASDLTQWVSIAWWEAAHAAGLSGAAETMVDNNRNMWTLSYNTAASYYYGLARNDIAVTEHRNAYDNLAGEGTVSSGTFGQASTTGSKLAFNLIHYHILRFEETGIWEDDPLKFLMGGQQYLMGANQVGYTLIHGMGPRYVQAHFHNNRQAFDDGVVPMGMPVYWGGYIGVQPATVSNLACGPAVQTVLVPDTVTVANADDINKTITPYVYAFPSHEPPYTAHQFISNMEFTIGGPIELNVMAAVYLNCWDGNTEGPTNPRLSVQVQAA
jgi:hypothetical protein